MATFKIPHSKILLSDKAISDADHDRFSRGNFIAGLANAVISPDEGISTGVSIGLVGRWGEGKSSVLNLLNAYIQKTNPRAVVVYFNPWIVTNREDLTAAFFKALTLSIIQNYGDALYNTRQSQIADAIGEELFQYARELGALLDFVKPGAGLVANFLIRAFNNSFAKKLESRRSIEAQRVRIESLFAELDAPIVVLIDEIDRLEDGEVRALAQLIKAIADFEAISYVLAYDEKRVAEALGAGASGRAERLERGMRYLEKIVQVPIQMPIIFDEELRSQLDAGVNFVLQAYGLSAHGSKRYEELCAIILPEFISTGRDIAKLISNFRIRYGFVMGEVEWVDVLGFCLLAVKAPHTAAYIRDYPDRVVFDGRDSEFTISNLKREFEDIYSEITSRIERTDSNRRLFSFLFPALEKTRTYKECHPQDIAFRKPLRTLLRLSLLPGAVSRAGLQEILLLPEEDLFSKLATMTAYGNIADAITRMTEIYQDLDIDEAKVWRCIGRGIELAPKGDFHSSYARRLAIKSIDDDFLSLAMKDEEFSARVPDILQVLLNARADRLLLHILWSLFFVIGAFDLSARGTNPGVFDKKKIEEISLLFSREILREDVIEKVIEDEVYAYFLLRIGAWSEELRGRLLHQLSESEAVLDRVIHSMLGGCTPHPIKVSTKSHRLKKWPVWWRRVSRLLTLTSCQMK